MEILIDEKLILSTSDEIVNSDFITINNWNELFNNVILEIALPDKKQLLLNVYDLKSKEFIIINGKGFKDGRLIILKNDCRISR